MVIPVPYIQTILKIKNRGPENRLQNKSHTEPYEAVPEAAYAVQVQVEQTGAALVGPTAAAERYAFTISIKPEVIFMKICRMWEYR
jgi:hypothetical protein